MAARISKANTAANVRLVELIRAAFDASALTRQELATASGVPEGTVAKILSGRAPVYADQMIGLAAALDADLTAWVREVRVARDSAK